MSLLSKITQEDYETAKQQFIEYYEYWFLNKGNPGFRNYLSQCAAKIVAYHMLNGLSIHAAIWRAYAEFVPKPIGDMKTSTFTKILDPAFMDLMLEKEPESKQHYELLKRIIETQDTKFTDLKAMAAMSHQALLDEIFALRSQVGRLEEVNTELQKTIEEQKRQVRTGYVNINITDVLHQLEFMQYMGDRYGKIIYKDNKIIRIQAVDDISQDQD